MAHERIAGATATQELVVSWIDDGQSVQVGMIWDDIAQQQRTPESDVEVAPGVPANPPIQACLDSEGRWSIYIDLPRAHINSLIRALRRGRNKAYGADE